MSSNNKLALAFAAYFAVNIAGMIKFRMDIDDLKADINRITARQISQSESLARR